MTRRKELPTRRRPLHESGWTSGLDARQLRAFVTLVEKGSMTAASEVLGVAQSTVSEALASLERTLGTPVISRVRGGHGMPLTPAGRALLPHAQSVLASLKDAHVAVAAATRQTSGRVEVVANESVSTYLLLGPLRALRQSWPNTHFAVTVGTCPSVREGVTSGRFDLGLRLHAEGSATAASTMPLTVVRLILFSRPEHPLLARSPSPEVTRDQLAPYPVFVSDASGEFQELIDGFFRQDRAAGPRLESLGTIEAVKRGVLTNPLALGVLPAYALTEELRSRRLREVSLRPGLPRMRLEATLSRARPVHPAAAELVEALRSTVGPRAPGVTAARQP